ncbi:replicative helicase loader/inhibitor [Listeria fleischmannii]|uniref:Uncharacterized protein n=1 Tax=Listeria fleischmannii FSL S10-1203 TaxID=1265822 RepID=W7DT27_9LIST|nr:replicative helicase loader/inhibitor [Listeria fleischmannii]EUJ56439.1 hypothetical protein MCOL2_08991 [Listeria fleischmannii FSL S10-1203]
MTPDESRNILLIIIQAYPQFAKQASKELYALWADKLKKGDFKRTKHLLDKHIEASSYPPAIADILVIADDRFEKTRQMISSWNISVESTRKPSLDELPWSDEMKAAFKQRQQQKTYHVPNNEEFKKKAF